MNCKIEIIPRLLHFKQPAGTSRGTYTTRKVWYLHFTSPDFPGRVGIGECAPLPALSCDELPDYDTSMFCHKKMKTNEETSLEALKAILPVLEGVDDWTVENIHTALFDLIAKLGVKNGWLLWPLRTAVSGKQFTPGGGVELCAILGKEDSIARIKKGIEKLS